MTNAPFGWRVLIFLALCGLGYTACDETHTFTIVNKTDSTVQIQLPLERPGAKEPLALVPFALKPEQSDSLSGGIFYPGSSLVVRAVSGTTVVFERTFAYNDLKDAGYRLEVTRQTTPKR